MTDALTLFDTTWLYIIFLEHYNQSTFIVLKLYLVGVPLKSVPRTMWIKSINSKAVTFCAPLKMLRKALNLFFSTPINTIWAHPSHRGCSSGPAPGCCSHLLQNVVYFRCPSPAHFLFLSWLPNRIYTCRLFGASAFKVFKQMQKQISVMGHFSK